jgi:quercetin dioxygenase-like cupin family protein
MPMTPLRTLVIASLGLLLLAGMLLAQRPSVTRTVVTREDVGAPGREAVLARVELAPGGASGWHTHPGDEISYVSDGTVLLAIAGEPPRPVPAGQGFVVPAGTVHNARNEGAAPVRFMAAFVVRKGLPLASPASSP